MPARDNPAKCALQRKASSGIRAAQNCRGRAWDARLPRAAPGP